MKDIFKVLFLIVIIFISFSSILLGQNVDTTMILKDAPKLFLDAHRIDMDYVRREIKFVNYVNDRRQADIYVLVTTNKTGSKGREYTLTFTGRNKFEGLDDTLIYNSLSTYTKDNTREGFIKALKMGLMPYMIETPLVNMFDIKFNYAVDNNLLTDKWDYWIFRTRLRGSFNGEESRNSYYISGSLDADRITEEWKIRLGADLNYDEENYNYPGAENYFSFTRSIAAHARIVKSLTDHWSLGVNSYFYSSTYRNIKQNYQLGPAIEYNIFPYSESTYREMRLSYLINYNFNKYYEKTIYDKMEELLVRQYVELNTEFTQPWGQIELNAVFSNFLSDASKNRLHIYSDMSINFFEGFAFSFGVGYSMIHDQINLPARDLNLDEILLRRSELATQYSYWMSTGISYTFGSIYNNIVNPRFN